MSNVSHPTAATRRGALVQWRIRGRRNLNAKEVEELFEIEFLSEDEFSSDNESPLVTSSIQDSQIAEFIQDDITNPNIEEEQIAIQIGDRQGSQNNEESSDEDVASPKSSFYTRTRIINSLQKSLEINNYNNFQTPQTLKTHNVLYKKATRSEPKIILN